MSTSAETPGGRSAHLRANALALATIALWASLAALGTALAHVPPLLLTGLGLLAGSLIALPLARFEPRRLAVSWPALALGVYGLLGYHLLLFSALRLAPPVQANLVNYLWPLGIVLMAPLFLPGLRLRRVHVLAALAGLAGAALAILGRSGTDGVQGTVGTGGTDAGSGALAGYACALAAAFVWASYSLLSKRMAQTRHAYSTAAIGSFGLISGVLAIACHWWLEPAAVLSTRDWILIAVLGLGPLGGAFYLWDAALKIGDARQIGVLSYLTPLLSTLILLRASGQPLSASIALATLLILTAAVLAARAR